MSSSLEFSWGFYLFIYLFSPLLSSIQVVLVPSLFTKVHLGGRGNSALHAADGFMLPSFLSWGLLLLLLFLLVCACEVGEEEAGRRDGTLG